VECVVSGPSATAHNSCRSCNITAHSPELSASYFIGVVKEVSNVDIILAVSLVNLLCLLSLTEVHVAAKLYSGISLKATESLILVNVTNGRPLVRTDRHNLALVLNAVHDEGEAVKLGNAALGDLAGLEGTRAEGARAGEAHAVNENALVFTSEVNLQLVENGGQGGLGCSELAKLE